MTAPRYVCVHGHFYQPPRENPWLEAIERQDSARPFHDWNERITEECYEPNTAARILDEEGRIEDLVNNYSRISFNIGPTLLSWMARETPEVYDAILRADRLSQERFGGHGSAIAQAYNHMIQPLANRRDKETQVRWGIRDFEWRFDRRPEGMWLAETAVDVETLEIMADEGILYTILAPDQVDAVRPPEGEWAEPDQDGLDTGRPYRVPLPSGKEITVFFYDGETSRAVAFERLLSDGRRFAERLLEPLDASGGEAPLSHIATDGESYGHHHRHGEMALAYALREVERREDVRLTNYGHYLELHPPTWEARVREDTSWSCAHGVDRWRTHCGCAGDPGKGWSQAWREPLRGALDWLRDELEPLFEEAAGEIFQDPWRARDRYVELVLDRSDASLEAYFGEVAGGKVEGAERIRALRLMEIQRHAMYMYTSCGWFFDDISGIETVQVLQYAGRAIHLAREVFGDRTAALEEEFVGRLEGAESNVPEWGNGREVYRRTVDPARVDLRKAAAHYAVSSVFDDLDDREQIYCYDFRRLDDELHEAGGAALRMGRVVVTSAITRNIEDLTYAILHLGNHNLAGGVRRFQEDGYRTLTEELRTPFLRTDFTTVLRVLDREFQASTYSLRSLFRDAQLRIVDTLLEASIEEAETTFAGLYETRGPLLRFLSDLGVPGPRPFVVVAEYVLNQRLGRILTQERPHVPAVRALVEAARATGVSLDPEEQAFEAAHALERLMRHLEGLPDDAVTMARIRELVRLLGEEAGLPLDLWKVQNAFWRFLQDVGPLPPLPEGADDVPPMTLVGNDRERGAEPEASLPDRIVWRRELEALARALRVAVPVQEKG